MFTVSLIVDYVIHIHKWLLQHQSNVQRDSIIGDKQVVYVDCLIGGDVEKGYVDCLIGGDMEKGYVDCLMGETW